MKILLTGGAGFIGSNLIHWLLRHTSDHILNLDALTYAGNLNSLDGIKDNPRYSFAQVNICDRAALKDSFAAFQPDAVMHLAAESHVDRSIDGPGTFIQTNIVGTFHLLQAALDYWQNLPGLEARSASHSQPGGTASAQVPQKGSFRFLHVSTDEVYGSLGPTGYFSESTPYDPHSPYSASKAASDHLARAWGHTYGLPVLVTNCSNNYGPYQFPEKLIPMVILKALRGEPIPVYGQGENIRDWLHVADHADALYTVLTRGSVGETYNIGGDNERRNIDLVRLLCEILDSLRPREDGVSYSEQITFVRDRPGHDLRYAIDASKIKGQLGWSPQMDHRTGFEETVLWYLNNEAWTRRILDGSEPLQRLGQL